MLIKKILILIPILLAGCGGYEDNHIKDYKVVIYSDSVNLRYSLVSLISRFNQEMGREVLEITSDKGESNSTMKFVSGLNFREDKLGKGKWLTVTKEESAFNSISMGTLTRDIYYGMSLEFDKTYMSQKLSPEANDNDSALGYHLLLHEIGHGLQMSHDNDPNSVMFPEIPRDYNSNLDLERFYRRARDFMDAQ